MLNRMFPFVLPLLVVATVLTGVVFIGQVLLFVGTEAAVPVALGMTFGSALIATLFSIRARRLPPLPMPNPGPREPVRRLDLGAGYLIGQFIFIFGAFLFLLFVFLATRR